MWYIDLWWISASNPNPKPRKIQTPVSSAFKLSFIGRTPAGEPVRVWLKGLPCEDRKRIGEDIKTVEFGWPVGMPVCRSVGGGIYEVRSDLARNRIARVLFYFDKNGRMVLLHGFIKKTQKTPEEELDLARRNKKKHERLQ